MRILLDVCTPKQVRNALPEHNVLTAAKLGWGELTNGQLVSAAESAGFDLLIICDKNMRYQQALVGRKIAILELWTNHRPTLEANASLIAEAVTSTKPGEYRVVERPEGI